MVKEYLIAGLFVMIFGINGFAQAVDMEAKLDGSTSNAGFSIKKANGSTIARFSGDGNVGIGTTDPSSKLHIEGETLARLRMVATSQLVEMIIDAAGGGFNRGEIGTVSDHDLMFFTSNSARMTIIASGNVGIGTADPGNPLEMESGAHVTRGGVWVNASSREYKENIRYLTTNEAMVTLAELRPARFNYKIDKEDECVGFIAEDVPELVATKDRKGLSSMDLIAVLTKEGSSGTAKDVTETRTHYA